jgi:hypothetical protein
MMLGASRWLDPTPNETAIAEAHTAAATTKTSFLALDDCCILLPFRRKTWIAGRR